MDTNLKGFEGRDFNKIIEMQRLPAVPVGLLILTLGPSLH
jgi:hypothetical protein